MNHRQRMQDCISGLETDRPPVALWRHFPVDDQDPKLLSEAILQFQNTYDFDFIKITPASSFCVRDYGVIDIWHGNPEGTRDFISYPIKNPKDWSYLQKISPREGNLKNQLDCIKLVKLGAIDTPFIQTIFDPMSQAKNLVGKDNLLVHMRQHPKELHIGLRRITENTISFIEACKSIGIDGIFFAIQFAQSSLLDRSELDEFVLPYAREILNHTKDLWLNLIHIHGKDIYFNELSDLPTSIINWHDQETSPSLRQAQNLCKAVVCGGLKQWDTLVYGSADQIAQEAREAIQQTNGRRFILGTGCVLPIIAPHGNISAVRRAVEEVA